MGRPKLATAVLVAIQLAWYVASAEDDQFAKAKQECAPQLAGLAPCLSYVGGDAKMPTMDCCTATKQVLAASKKCVCLLVKYKDDPSLGVKFDVNRALALPALCHAAAAFSQCPSLLHLAPNSTEAKMFDNLDKSSNTTTATSTPATATATASPATATNDTKAKNGGLGSHERLRTNSLFYGAVVAAFFFLVSFF